jgi:hypothetical protein
MNMLPLHAAGYHNSCPMVTALDRVVSSYVSSLKALFYVRDVAQKAERNALKEKALLVAMPYGELSLSSTEHEVHELQTLLSGVSIDVTAVQNPQRSFIISELPKYNGSFCMSRKLHKQSISKLLRSGRSASHSVRYHLIEYRVREVGVPVSLPYIEHERYRTFRRINQPVV